MGETVVMARRRVKGKTKDGGSWVLVARGQSAVGGGAVAITVVVGVAVAIMAVAVGGAEVENWARRIAQGSQQKGSRGATPRTGRGDRSHKRRKEIGRIKEANGSENAVDYSLRWYCVHTVEKEKKMSIRYFTTSSIPEKCVIIKQAINLLKKESYYRKFGDCLNLSII
ncbi:Protein of unknown function [Gryllus bimaculatus]|nr:Protein of unknown function [Gryllus bimaculatus]